MSGIRARAWSPYVTGVIIGLLQIPAFLVAGAVFSVSSAYGTLSAVLAFAIDPDLGRRPLVDHLLNAPQSWWLVGVVLGTGIGAWISVSLSRAVPHDTLPDGRSGAEPISTVRGFLGGFLMLMGARIADGCVTGDGLSGLSQLSAGSLVAVVAMFSGGVIMARVLSEREPRR